MNLKQAGTLLTLCTCLAACAGQQEVAVITFPVDGARLDSPVTLEASQTIEWIIDGQRWPASQRWSGELSEGMHSVSAGSSHITVQVKPPYPNRVIKTVVPGADGTVAVPAGTFDMMVMNFTPQIQAGPGNAPIDAAHGAVPTLKTSGLFHTESRRLAALHAAPVRSLKSQNLGEAPASLLVNLLNLDGTGNVRVDALALYRGPYLTAYVDSRQPMTEAQKQQTAQIAQKFERKMGLLASVFGKPSDVDGNGRVTLVFTSSLNDSNIAVGYFNPADLLARNTNNPYSNEQEILYLGVPVDRDLNFSGASLTATACHEFTHLLTFTQKSLTRMDQATVPVEEVSVAEGMSHLAEDLCGYGVQGGNVAFVAAYLTAVSSTSLSGKSLNGREDSPARRGAAYLLLRQLMEQGAPDFLKHVSSTADVGWNNVAREFGDPLENLLARQWWTLALAGRGGAAPYIFRPQVSDPETGDPLGVNVVAGTVYVQDFPVELEGIADPPDFAANLPAQSFTYRRVHGPARLKVSPGLAVQIRRAE